MSKNPKTGRPAPAPSTQKNTASRVRGLDVRWRLALALVLGLAVGLLSPHSLGPLARTVAGWLGFSACDVGLILLGMWQADADDIRRVAATEDLPRTLAFGVILVAATASLGAVIGLMGSLKDLTGTMRLVHLGLCVGAVVLAWQLVHLVFTLRYAHAYYNADADTGHDTGGLVFPDDQDRDEGQPKLTPNYIDFAYFSFIIAMTAQTADIGIANRSLRATALLHGCIAFLFNTVIVALTIGTISSLLN
ncbi:MAG: DUF1345 domain-containing protein [Bacteroidota bacterium]|nr:DUF1345 domain-containing protein [Bacteroidota bacterium]